MTILFPTEDLENINEAPISMVKLKGTVLLEIEEVLMHISEVVVLSINGNVQVDRNEKCSTTTITIPKQFSGIIYIYNVDDDHHYFYFRNGSMRKTGKPHGDVDLLNRLVTFMVVAKLDEFVRFKYTKNMDNRAILTIARTESDIREEIRRFVHDVFTETFWKVFPSEEIPLNDWKGGDKA